MDTAQTRTSLPDKAPTAARDRATFASFGDNGTTATANAYGNLLQITRYFGNAPSGFFCADLPLAPEPRFVEARMDYLQESCQSAARGMRLLFDNTENGEQWKAAPYISAMPKMSFLHDRWPSFITKTPVFDLDIQYLVSQNTVYQIYTFKLKNKSSISTELPMLAIDANLMLRNLNFVEDDEDIGHEGHDKQHSYHVSKDGHSIAAVHENESVGLFVSIFINSRLQKFKAAEHPENYENLGDPEYYEITPDEQAAAEFLENKCLKIAVAYKMNIVSSDTLADMDSIFSSNGLLEAERILENPFTIIPFSNDEHLNFILRRNLEHVLSVCSIPIKEMLENNAIPPHRSASAYCTAVALTCGDMSGHRVATSASFYAFQLLVTALKYFQETGLSCSYPTESGLCEDYACKLSYRIRLTCRGHLKWLCYAHTRTNFDLISTSYWATGEPILEWESSSSEMPITNTLFSLIKAAGFCQIIADKHVKEDIAESFENMVSFLINHLYQKEKNKERLFPRYNEEQYTYLTSDHAMIWWAIKSAEEIGLRPSSYIIKGTERRLQPIIYSSTNIQKSIVTKLATQNRCARKIMLATSRSFCGDIYFLEADDTILFHAMTVGLFDRTQGAGAESDIWRNKFDVWENIVDYQVQRKDDFVWTNPLQIALHFMMSANNKCMDWRPAEEVYGLTRSIIFSSSSSNGLLPGLLDESQEPILFDSASSRDSYWHATFEVPYILWNYKMQKTLEPSLSDPGPSEISQAIVKINQQMDAMTANFGTSTHKGNVNETHDQWLYKEPRFFTFNQDLSTGGIAQFCKDHIHEDCGTVIDEAISNVLEKKAFDKHISGYIIDIPKKEVFDTKHILPRNVTESNEVRKHISTKRVSPLAKKRLLHFYPINLETALFCYIGSSEKDAISLFFDRHASYDRHFSEDTLLVLNKWVTELHLPFYQITGTETSSGEYQTIAGEVGIPFMRNIRRDKDTMWINRATMGFRFDGDILDRYWTCHFLEYSPRKLQKQKREKDEKDRSHDKITKRVDGGLNKQSWRQRRILELVLFDLILEEILRSTKEILKEAQWCIERSFRPEDFDDLDLRLSKSIFLDPLIMVDKVDGDNFISTNKLWNDLEPIFQLVKDALNENLATIKLWMEREKECRRDDLRWTFNDERNYRSAISTLQVLNRHKVDKLERYSANIASFNASFARKLEAMRNDLDQRGADDIRLFTYVTVVFLPVGFATSVFSMSGSPSGDTLHGMIILATLALLITLVALVNAHILDRILGPVFHIGRSVTESIIDPLISPVYKFIVQPISRSVYLFLWDSAYYIALHCYYQIYIRRFSPDYPREHNLNQEVEDKDRLFKRISEQGPVREARKKYIADREKQKNELLDSEKEVRKEMEERYKEEEEENFKKNELEELNRKVIEAMNRLLRGQLKDAIRTELEAIEEDIGALDAEERRKLGTQLKERFEPMMKERLLKEGKMRIRKETNAIIESRVNGRIKDEAKKRIENRGIQNEERSKYDENYRKIEVREAKRARGGIVRRIIKRKSQETSAGGEYGEPA